MRVIWFQYFEMFSLLWAIWCYRGLNAFSIGIMIPILVLDNVVEIIGVNYAHFHWANNYLIYNLYYLLSTPLYLCLFATMLDGSRKDRMRLIAAGVIVEALLLANCIFLQGWWEFNTYSSLLYAITQIVISCIVLTRLAIRKDDESGLLQDPIFWINAMILLFNLVTFIVLGMHKYIMLNHLEMRHKNLYLAITQAANAVLYTGFCYAFLLCKQLKRSK